MEGKDYINAEAFLNSVPRFTSKNPMGETVKFYEYLGGDGNLGSIVHVAGTNGKGSVCAYLQSICKKSGYRTAVFISPHLITTRERFIIDGEIISEEAFVEAFEWLNGKMAQYRSLSEATYNPTYFERLFFMGLYIFSKAKPDVTILETGLGGRLDTTNVVKKPSVSVITEIGFDHMAYLGDTLEAIAGEKAGIIKQGVPVVFSDRRESVSRVLKQKSEEMGVKYYPVSKKDYKINEITKKSIDFSVSNLYDDYVSLLINTTATYQVENASLAYRASEVLRNECGLGKISDKSIAEGIAGMHWMGRMEEIRPGIYIDGAHNEDGIEAFSDTLKSACDDESGKCVVVFSVVKDKQYDKMIHMLCELDMVTDFMVTHIPGQRGADLDEIGALFGKYCQDDTKIYTYEDIKDAIIQAVAVKGEHGRVYIVGSLYLAGIVEDIFMEERITK